jgi:hypothetical protein
VRSLRTLPLSRTLRRLRMRGEYNWRLPASRFAELYDSLPCLERLELESIVEFNAAQLVLLSQWPCPFFPSLRFFSWTDAYAPSESEVNHLRCGRRIGADEAAAEHVETHGEEEDEELL